MRATGAEGHIREAICPGCFLFVPGGPAPPGGHPLIVALHGDGGDPVRLLLSLRREAGRRGVAILAPACPRQRGCSGSFWRWSGAPSWLGELASAVAAQVTLDPRRLYLLGWSGGASYLTDRMAEIPGRFAAWALIGGGMPARHGPACAACQAPVYYLAGEQNPLHELARAAAGQLRQCGHQVSWITLPGTGHSGEWAAMSRRAGEILDFLVAQKRPCG